MKLKHLENLVTVDEDVTDDKFGTYYDKRSVEQLLNYGLILLDKPPGPTSHQVVAWAKKILEIPKAGHSGTLDPQVTGVLPLGLGDATKALGVLLFGSKEYQGLGRLHSLPSKEKLDGILKEFCGDIYQKPPQRSAVSRQTRIRKIFELELLEQKERLILIRITCESGTYIRKLIYDIGEICNIPGIASCAPWQSASTAESRTTIDLSSLRAFSIGCISFRSLVLSFFSFQSLKASAT